MAQVAIAYAHEDTEKAREIVGSLARRGLTCLWDWTPPVGMRWDEFVTDAIRVADLVIVLWTKNSIRSDHVKEQAVIAKTGHKKIISFHDETITPRQIPVIIPAALAPTPYSRTHLDYALVDLGIEWGPPIQAATNVIPSPTTKSTRLLLSYRRKDSAAMAGRIYDRLITAYPRDDVFMDIDAMPLGVDFRDHLEQRISQCRILLAVIGPGWLGERDAQANRRIDNPADPVRMELEIAFREGVTVVPVLIGDASMPRPDDLPDSLARLPFRNGAVVDDGRDFHAHMDRLIAQLKQI